MRSFLRKLASICNHFHIAVALLLVAVIHVVGWSMPGLFSHSLYAQATLKATDEKPIFELGESTQTERPLFELQSTAQVIPEKSTPASMPVLDWKDQLKLFELQTTAQPVMEKFQSVSVWLWILPTIALCVVFSLRRYNLVINAIKTLHPAYFAFIMSTGIISIAANLLGFKGIAYGLFYINIIAYAIILSLQILRVRMFWTNLYNDLSNPKLSLVFFTTVAGTNVLGSQFVSVVNQPEIAKIFWYFGIFLWTIVSLSTFNILFIKCDQRIEMVMHGGWLIATVGTQSVAVLGGLLAPKFGDAGSFVIFSSFVWWMIGSFLYMVLITLIMYRLVFFKISPDALVPPYWINMGALAITTLAGSILCITIPKTQGSYADFLGFTKGFTLFFWSFGTWWIPFLVIIGIWKYVFHKTQYKYTPLYWGMVFPLGMYTACTIKLSQALEIPFIANISKYFIYAAYVAWSFIFITMILSMIKAATAKEAATPARESKIAPPQMTGVAIRL